MDVEMNEENATIASGSQSGSKQLFNSPHQSDVRFLVDGQIWYGHKQVLAKGSPVFESMFFGQLKEKREVIEIKDLTSVGFENVIKFIYGHEIDYLHDELYESYMAADKYLLRNFKKKFLKYIEDELSAKNSCTIYEQLLKIGNPEEISFAHVRAYIARKSSKAFKSKTFTQIGQETLISLLSLDELSISEFDLLAAVSKWIDCEVRRQGLRLNDENRRRVFEPIKGYILFSALKPEKIANCDEVARLLTDDELLAFLLHLLNKSKPFTVQLKTSRRAGASTLSVFVDDSSPFDYDAYDYHHDEDFCSIEMYLSVDRKVCIRTIHTTCPDSDRCPTLQIETLNNRSLHLTKKGFVKDGNWSFSLEPPFEMEANSSYKLIAHTNSVLEETSEEEELDYKGLVTFTVKRYSPNCLENHCIRGLDFTLLD